MIPIATKITKPIEAREDPGVGREDDPRLAEDALPVAEGIAGHDEHAVGDDQPERREAEPAMGPGEAIHAEHLVEPRAARHEDELEQGQVGTEQAGHLADRRQDATQRAQLIEAAVADPHREDEDRIAGQHPDDVAGRDRPDAREGHAAGDARAGRRAD